VVARSQCDFVTISLTQYIRICFFGCSQRNFMSLYYSLAREISGEKLVKEISQLVNNFIKSGGDANNSILSININTIKDYQADSPLPKLVHKDISDCST